ncbi:translation initiation factor IF-2-like [Catharus ustulatus]|uniref:translation initiation factor IF-2-like n=1 Tax=Catharus ustulatus TaxID=91951 RepID=UPI00140A7624|nr:translation initiation factor IF-2-like [Catharus ustulatus]
MSGPRPLRSPVRAPRCSWPDGGSWLLPCPGRTLQLAPLRSPARQRPTPVSRKKPLAGAFEEPEPRAAGTADSCLAPALARTPAAAPRAASLPAVHGALYASRSRALPRPGLQTRSSDRAPGGGTAVRCFHVPGPLPGRRRAGQRQDPAALAR